MNINEETVSRKLKAKVERRYLLELVLCTHPTHHPVPSDVKHKDKNHDFCDFLEEWQLCQSVLQEFNATLVLILSQETLK